MVGMQVCVWSGIENRNQFDVQVVCGFSPIAAWPTAEALCGIPRGPGTRRRARRPDRTPQVVLQGTGSALNLCAWLFGWIEGTVIVRSLVLGSEDVAAFRAPLSILQLPYRSTPRVLPGISNAWILGVSVIVVPHGHEPTTASQFRGKYIRVSLCDRRGATKLDIVTTPWTPKRISRLPQ